MARLTLNPNYSLKDLGCEVLKAARGRAVGSKGQEEEAEMKIREMIADREHLDVKFVYDTDKMINIIIPDLSDKITEDNTDHDCWCCDFVYEAMGGIVVYGCGK
ncbi:hypothetical protein HW561_18680 [Rhodobacteraceae bacterium B1Z28]|uniref:Uncharacterized protein n=1 Tax=Ruegeria haliotis TaxID=2747601 RepID=A0ABX2PXL1_9RHOB|nr:hypothetical protein [Ruegeria haliotis]NVO57827.1 hypothetical protein [Ruegeria haliotis]